MTGDMQIILWAGEKVVSHHPPMSPQSDLLEDLVLIRSSNLQPDSPTEMSEMKYAEAHDNLETMTPSLPEE